MLEGDGVLAASGLAVAGHVLWVAGLALALAVISLSCYEARCAGTGLAGCFRRLGQRCPASVLAGAAAATAVGAAFSVWL